MRGKKFQFVETLYITVFMDEFSLSIVKGAGLPVEICGANTTACPLANGIRLFLKLTLSPRLGGILFPRGRLTPSDLTLNAVRRFLIAIEEGKRTEVRVSITPHFCDKLKKTSKLPKLWEKTCHGQGVTKKS